ncbi:adenylyltransferase/cytidyltransferase family protein [Candidatus Woesearchaeota archaeon]|jgi:nicotinamide-nucleotide adenylyltransferase|nr:adenylyltransferase/cytidyltransferase family protein [Candidatus Woesearchaeota archaeon]
MNYGSNRTRNSQNGGIRRGLYLGRFQILHNGHLHVLKHIDQEPDIDEILINIGSSQYSRTNKSFEAPWIINPFSYEERKALVDRSLQGEITKPYKIIALQDQHYCPSWIASVFHANPEFHVFFSNTARERDLFEERGIESRGIPIKDKFHAQIIREMIAYGDDFSQYVPKGVVEVVRERDLSRILREFYAEHAEEIDEVHAMQRKLGIACYADLFGEKDIRKQIGD